MSPPRVAILDYGCGNLASVANAVRKVGGEPLLHPLGNGLTNATHLILPGQGAFRQLADHERTELELYRHSLNVPILGICLGMQLMCEGSEEAPGVKGLGWLPFWVARLTSSRLPHVGWNRVGEHDYYFCHSYGIPWMAHDRTGLPAGVPVANSAEYERQCFLAEFRSGNLWAVQFHPEKSGRAGLALLAEFLRL